MLKKIKDYMTYQKYRHMIRRELLKTAAFVLSAVNEALEMPEHSEHRQKEE